MPFWGACNFAGGIDFPPVFNSPPFFLSPRCVLGFSRDAGSFPGSQSIKLEDRDCTLALTGNVQLHNRADLSCQMSFGGNSQAANDCELVLTAYRKWGEECGERLEGEFSFAIWDEAAARLFLCVDHFASTPLMYWQSGTNFVFSSSLRQILRTPGVPREFNRGKLAGALSLPVPGSARDETFHRGILSIPPGATLTVDALRLTKRTYWFPVPRPEIVPQDSKDAFAALRELMIAAVRNRLRGARSVTTWLSGGLDSSAATALAAQALTETSRGLIALSAVLPSGSSKSLSDEREFVDQFRSWPNIQIEYVAPQSGGPFDYLEDPSHFESTFLQSSREYLQRSLEDAALSFNSDLNLDGQYGELGPTFRVHGHYAESVRQFRLRNLFHNLCEPELTVGSRRRALRTLAGEFKRVVIPARPKPPLVYFARDLYREWSALQKPASRWPSTYCAHLETVQQHLWKHAIRAAASGEARGRVSFPMRDKRVVEFCLSAPTEFKIGRGCPRYLVRGALSGILPERIRWRLSKAPFASDYYSRYNAQLPTARAFVQAIGPKDPVRSVVDVDQLLERMVRVDPLAADRESLLQIPCSIYLICFLRQFSEFR